MTAPEPWPVAHEIAADAAGPLPERPQPLAASLGLVLARSLPALTDLPAFDSAAMDGWAVAGPGPWRVSGRVLAGQRDGVGWRQAGALRDGEAVEIATGAALPSGATAVLRAEHGELRDGRLHHLGEKPDVPIGADIRPLGQECRRGDRLVPAGTRVTPALLGLAAAAGYDTLPVRERPRVAVHVLGDELIDHGLPGEGKIRDALGPTLTAWLTALGVTTTLDRVPDDADQVLARLASSPADVVVTTGGTARGPVDHLHGALRKLGARLLVDGVAVRPGHPMLLARHGRDRFVVGLPGNPLAAIAGFATLGVPLLRSLAGLGRPRPGSARLRESIAGHPRDTVLVPVGDGMPQRYQGPAMLRGLATADGLAVVPPGGCHAGDLVRLLDVGGR